MAKAKLHLIDQGTMRKLPARLIRERDMIVDAVDSEDESREYMTAQHVNHLSARKQRGNITYGGMILLFIVTLGVIGGGLLMQALHLMRLVAPV